MDVCEDEEYDEDDDEEEDDEDDDDVEFDVDDRFHVYWREPNVYRSPINVGGSKATTLHVLADSGDDYSDEVLFRCTYDSSSKTCKICVFAYEFNECAFEYVVDGYGSIIPSHFSTLIVEKTHGSMTIQSHCILKCPFITRVECINKCNFEDDSDYQQLREDVENGRNLTIIVNGKCVLGGAENGEVSLLLTIYACINLCKNLSDLFRMFCFLYRTMVLTKSSALRNLRKSSSER